MTERRRVSACLDVRGGERRETGEGEGSSCKTTSGLTGEPADGDKMETSGTKESEVSLGGQKERKMMKKRRDEALFPVPKKKKGPKKNKGQETEQGWGFGI